MVSCFLIVSWKDHKTYVDTIQLVERRNQVVFILGSSIICTGFKQRNVEVVVGDYRVEKVLQKLHNLIKT